MRWGRTHWVVLAVAMLASAALTSSALARSLYVTNYKSDTVSVIDGTTNQIVGPPISTGAGTGPYTVAITPRRQDGLRGQLRLWERWTR